MTQYTLIGAASTRAGRALWMLEELGVPYEHVGVKPHAEEVTRHYPRGKVPVLLVDGEPLTDSTAIIQYLADAHGRFTAAAGTLDRARQDAMLHLLLDEFDAVLWTSARHSFILPAERRVPEVKDSLRWEFSVNQASLVRRMGERPYVTGDDFTVADIVLAHCLIWARAAKFEITEPALQDYARRIAERPAFRRVFMKG
ncbi:glutathione S-transferase family protein [Pararhodobacter aggregans]|uniref:Glutathione S-transferase n=1 Tax=Pararhodobacter aggregans TaxID=404875 RepID=A0A2T7UQ50_9RHOB|nr:glutathione S-transferase family protein [Pararhodobacter aggregans]PTX01579.1 glutathione S-transferase [Pararhodobacter aggregans]PVE46843.1 glutathione S-transferase [Pararhodobacter aggregans]